MTDPLRPLGRSLDRPLAGEMGVSDFTEVQSPGAGEPEAEGAAGAGDDAGAGQRDHEHAPIHVARRAWYGLLTQAVDKVLPVVILLYLARALEPAAFGVYSFVIAYLAFFQIVSDYSIDTVLVRTMSQQPGERDALLQAGLGLKLVMALVSVVVSVALVGVASGHQTPPGLMLVAALNLPTALGGAYRAWHRSRLEIAALFVQAALRAVLLAIGVYLAVTNDGALVEIFLAMSVANLLTFLVVAFSLRRKVTPAIRFDLARWRMLASGVLPLMINAFAMTVSLRIGHILLMSLRGPVDVGQLSAASRVTEAFTLLPEALMISVYPLMAGLHARDSPALVATVERSTRYLVAATGLPVVLCAVQGSQIMRLLFGPSFGEAGVILSLLALTALLNATGTVILNLLVATHNERVLWRTTLAFAGIGAVASWLAISAFGTIGAAMATLAASAASQAWLAWLPATRRYIQPTLRAAARPVAAVAITIAIARLWSFGGWTQAGVTVAIYVTAVALLGVFGDSERRLIASLLGARRGKA